MSCAPKNLQPQNVAVSADILNATACFPTAPGAGTGVVFCIHKQHLICLNNWTDRDSQYDITLKVMFLAMK